ncbi:hypothetical protein [Roseimaritima sediminicola]|uniref:hypothetical protein n=1 Tax=Roseimaritima sediminicola TaxID=2662066 RepID=UPI0012984438|nr:hypothetical protein [Roseimaritima sediminicola]
MKTFELRLVPKSPDRLRRARGFVVFGAGPADWLDALYSQPAAADTMQFDDWDFYVLPSPTVPARADALVCLPPSSCALPQRCRLPGAVPLACVVTDADASSSLWMPVDCGWTPAVPQTLVEAMLPQGLTCVWMASTGLIGYEPGDRQSLSDLLAPPSESQTAQRWQAPPEGTALPQRITQFGWAEPPGMETVFGEADRSIGNQSDLVQQWKDDSLRGQLQAGFLEMMRKWGFDPSKQGDGKAEERSGAESSSPPSWLAKKMSSMMQSQREQQLNQLLEMLRADPDQALQYALPIGDDASHRGLADPRARLPSHTPDFSLAGLGGGGPADFWEIDPRVRWKLDQVYREQANREVALGRHRRAAYIYAHLLGDLSGAAQVLEQGQYWSEAAALYQQRLSRPRDAARCLAASGQISKAAELYVELNEFVEAGDLWQRAGQGDRAAELYRRGVEYHRANGQPLRAARLLDDKLDQRGAAIDLLLSQWPRGIDPVRSADQAFAWLGQSGDHAGAWRALKRLCDDAAETNPLATAAVTATLATTYPDNGLRREAEDRCRVAVARGLHQAPPIEQRERMSVLRKLDVLDPELSLDVGRFLDNQPRALVSAVPVPLEPARLSLAYLGRFDLPEAERFVHAEMLRGELLVLAAKRYKLLAHRVAALASDHPRRSSTLLQLGQPLAETTTCAVRLNNAEQRLAVEVVFCGPAPVHFRADYLASPYQQSAWWLSTPLAFSQMPEGTAVAADGRGTVWALVPEQNGIVLREWSSESKAVRTYLVDPAVDELRGRNRLAATGPQALGEPRLRLFCVGGRPWAIVGNALCKFTGRELRPVQSLPGMVQAVCPSLPHTRQRLAIAHRDGVDVFWFDATDAALQSIVRGTSHQHVALLHGAQLAAIAGDRLSVYQIHSQRVTAVGTVTLRRSDVLALLAISAASLAVIYQDGSIDRYCVG